MAKYRGSSWLAISGLLGVVPISLSSHLANFRSLDAYL